MTELLSRDITERLRVLVTAESVAERDGLNLESLDPDEVAATGPCAEQIAERLERALSPETRPPEEVGDPVQYRRALDILLGMARQAGNKLDEDPQAALTKVEALALEAVVRTDGSRPSLLVQDGRVDADQLTAGDWSQTLRDTADALSGPIAAVGRVEPANATGRNFFGTCWVVDTNAGLALTNLHVVEAIWRRLAFRMERRPGGFRIRDGAFVDFVAESGSTRSSKCQVTEALIPGFDGPGFARLDAAVLRLQPLGDSTVPEAIHATADTDGPAGTLHSFCIVGFPAAPRHAGGIHDGVDWTWVNAAIFGNRYGVKRLAPGVTHRPLGSVAGDPRKWVFGHDGTTLGGNSGSPLLNWLEMTPGGFGLHFAGVSMDTNIAHSLAACADELRILGVPVHGGGL